MNDASVAFDDGFLIKYVHRSQSKMNSESGWNPVISLGLSQARCQQLLLALETLFSRPLPIWHSHKNVPLRFDLAVLENRTPERPLRPPAKVKRTC
jgi:hypothetical protein